MFALSLDLRTGARYGRGMETLALFAAVIILASVVSFARREHNRQPGTDMHADIDTPRKYTHTRIDIESPEDKHRARIDFIAAQDRIEWHTLTDADIRDLCDHPEASVRARKALAKRMAARRRVLTQTETK